MMGLMDSESRIPTAQQLPALTDSAVGTSSALCQRAVKVEGGNDGQFPAGLRVLVVDDDPICLLILDRMLQKCLYQVTTCGRATTALAMLRENKDRFDLVISDVYMPDMDGFKLLELVGLEMDLPVIMMSAHGETSAVMKGITHGACDYLLKPVRIEELRNIWQHVVRKKWRESEQFGGHEENHKRGTHDGDHNSSAYESADGNWKQSKKRKDAKEDEEEEDVEQDTEDPSSTKKPRVVWSVDLHQQFVSAVNQLGIDKAVPKRILELMSVQGLTRENVASHLQKYRLYLKRISGVTHQPGSFSSSFAGGSDSTFNTVSGGGLGGLSDLRALATTGELSPHALMSTLQAGLIGRLGVPSNLSMGSVDPSLLLQLAAMQGVNTGALVRSQFGQSLPNSNMGNLHQSLSSGPDLKQLSQGSQLLSTFGQLGEHVDKGQAAIPTLQLAAAVGLGGAGQLVGVNSNSPSNPNNNALMLRMLQQQAGGQLSSPDVLNLTTGGLLGQHMLSNDICGTRPIAPLSASVNINMNIGVGVQSIGQVRLALDNKNLQLPGVVNGNIPAPSNVNVSSSLISSGLESELSATGFRALGSILGGISEGAPQIVRGTSSHFNSISQLNHGQNANVCPNSRQNWRDVRLGQDVGHTSSPVVSPRYNQISSSSQGLHVGNGQEHALGQIPVFSGQTMSYKNSLALDSGRPKPIAGCVSSQGKQSTAANELKVKDATLDLLMGSKGDSALLPEIFSSSDDLLNLFFRQQQEGFGFTESDLASDGYTTLDNMYVK